MDFADLEADFARIQWPVPHLIGPAINEDDEELLLPLEGRLMELPHLQMDIGVAIRGQNLPPQNQGPVQRLQPNLTGITLPEHWLVYKEMTYLGVEEENQELWDAQQSMEEEEEEEQEGDVEMLTSTAVSQQGPVDGSPSTKRPAQVPNDKRLLQEIISSGVDHIATIGLQELPMPDATPPAFVPILEPPHPQQ